MGDGNQIREVHGSTEKATQQLASVHNCSAPALQEPLLLERSLSSVLNQLHRLPAGGTREKTGSESSVKRKTALRSALPFSSLRYPY